MLEKQKEFNGQIKAIFRGGRINPIKWGGTGEKAEWHSWPLEHRLAYAMELASAMNQAADALQKERNELLSKVKAAKQQTENAEAALHIQKMIVTENMTTSNANIQGLAEKIQRLQQAIKQRDKTIEDLRR